MLPASLRRVALAGVILALMTLFGTTLSAEPVLLAEEARATLVVEAQSRLVVSGIHGTVSIRAGRPGEIRFMARTRGESPEDLEVAVWQDEESYLVRPIEGSEDQPAVMEMAVSPGVAVEVAVDDSSLLVQGLRDDVVIRGAGVELNGRNLHGSLSIDLADSRAVIQEVAGALLITADRLELTAHQIGAGVTLDLQQSHVLLNGVFGGLDGDLDGSNLRVDGVRGELRLQANRGVVELQTVNADGELWLTETTLKLDNVAGRLEVNTDSDAQFTDVSGSLSVRSDRFGASIRGKGSSGPLDLEATGGEVTLSELGGKTRISGTELTVQINDNKGPLTIETRSSTIVIQNSDSTLTIENDFGDVEILNVSQAVKVVNRTGDVTVRGLKAALDLRAEGDQVHVVWAKLEPEGDSHIENESGDVHVRLPPDAACRIDAEARYGRIESEIDEIRVTDDGNFASGLLGRASRPVIRVESGADLFFEASSAAGARRRAERVRQRQDESD